MQIVCLISRWLDCQEPVPWFLKADYLLVWITCVLVVATSLTLYAIWQQTIATRASVRLQELGLRQWVSLVKWEAPLAWGEDTNRLLVSYSVQNGSSMLIELDQITTTFGGGQTSSVGVRQWLAPENPYVADISVELTAEQTNLFLHSKLVLSIESSVFYTDALGRKWNQIFGRNLICGTSGVSVIDTKNLMRDSTPFFERRV